MKDLKLPKIKLNNKLPVSIQVYTYLRSLIIENHLIPGTQLSENELSSLLNVSRQPVRESLARLKREELVEVFPQKGSFVKKISVKNLKEICFVRDAIECTAVRDAMSLENKEFMGVCKKLKRNLELQHEIDIEKKNAHERFLKLDDEFHSLICSFSGTTIAWDLVQSIKGNLDRIRFFTFAKISRIDKLYKEHCAILNCIESKEAESACELLKNHLYTISSTYKIAMEENEEWFCEEDVAIFRKWKKSQGQTK